MKNILKILKEEQEKEGYLSRMNLKNLSEKENLNLSQIFDVASFYSFIYLEKKGKNVIKVCKSVPCYLKGEENILDILGEVLNIKVGEITPDGKFSIELVNCIGCCDTAPAVMIQDEVYGNLTEEKLRKILERH